jgi:hypothetical protein
LAVQCRDLDSLSLAKVLKLEQTAHCIAKDESFYVFLPHDKRSQQFVFVLVESLHKLVLDVLQVDMHVLVH